MSLKTARKSVVARTAVAAFVGAATAASGFTPFDHANAVLNISSRPFLVLITPPVLLALAAVVSALMFRKQQTGPGFRGLLLKQAAASGELNSEVDGHEQRDFWGALRAAHMPRVHWL